MSSLYHKCFHVYFCIHVIINCLTYQLIHKRFSIDSLYNNATAASASCVPRRGWSETSLHLIQRIIIIFFSPRVSVNHNLGHNSLSPQHNDSSHSSKRHFVWWKLEKAIVCRFTLTQFRAAKETLAFEEWRRKGFAKADQCTSFVIAQVVILVVHILFVYVFIRLKNLNSKNNLF